MGGPPLILLDTNVLSELVKPQPNQVVVDELRRVSDRTYISSVVLGELYLGVALCPDGQRKQSLRLHADAVREAYRDRTISLTAGVVQNYATSVAALRARGVSITVNDAYIAATAVTHGLRLYTRNVRDFADYPDLEVANPWQS